MPRLQFLRTAFVLFFVMTIGSPAFSQDQPATSVLDARVEMFMQQSLQKRAAGQEQTPRMLDALIHSRDQQNRLLLHLFIRTTDQGASLSALEGVQITGTYGDIIAARVPADHLSQLATMPAVQRVEAMNRLRPGNNEANEDTGVNQLHAVESAEFPNGYKGEGVIIGVIDTGIDIRHNDFRDENGTRIIYLRETNDEGTTVWSADDIDNNPESVTQVDTDGHGTHVTGTAASSNPEFLGVAPMAEIIAVKTDFSDGDIVAGVEFVFNKADSLGMPAVANLSLGGHYGPHDGTSLSDLALSSLTGPGKVIVAAAGNEGSDMLHTTHDAQGNAPDSGSYTLLDYWEGYSVIAAYFDDPADVNLGIHVYYNGQDFYSESWGAGDGFNSEDIAITDDFSVAVSGETATTEGIHEILIQAEYEVTEESGIDQDSLEVYLYAYGSGRFNAWVLQGDWFSEYEDANLNIIGGNTDLTVGQPATSRSVIAVGSHVTRASWTSASGDNWGGDASVGDISGFSSIGPSRDGRILPHITAPGQFIGSAMSQDIPAEDIDDRFTLDGGLHMIQQGTSMATPHVAGIVALMLQANPLLSSLEARDILQTTARNDEFTGAVLPNNIWGAGKVDAFTAVTQTATSIDEGYLETSPVVAQLYPNYPNPFNPATVIRYDIDAPGEVTLSVYNSIGQQVATLVQNSLQSAGSYRVSFDGSALSSGVYMVKLQTSGGIQTRMMTLLK
ncbi:MAG: extracellular subtilisin-like serine protease [Bacteroidetes bacterium HLUCCA01]|nr:MAG: extracellular subtilisin-like serine protease [Bacteroidetes bacterium HLUCCA01]